MASDYLFRKSTDLNDMIPKCNQKSLLGQSCLRYDLPNTRLMLLVTFSSTHVLLRAWLPPCFIVSAYLFRKSTDLEQMIPKRVQPSRLAQSCWRYNFSNARLVVLAVVSGTNVLLLAWFPPCLLASAYLFRKSKDLVKMNPKCVQSTWLAQSFWRYDFANARQVVLAVVSGTHLLPRAWSPPCLIASACLFRKSIDDDSKTWSSVLIGLVVLELLRATSSGVGIGHHRHYR